MEDIIERLAKNQDHSESKSYFIGIENGREWAAYADYFKRREWSEADASEFDDLTLPDGEVDRFWDLSNKTELDWKAYLKGWLDGVRQVKSEY